MEASLSKVCRMPILAYCVMDQLSKHTDSDNGQAESNQYKCQDNSPPIVRVRSSGIRIIGDGCYFIQVEKIIPHILYTRIPLVSIPTDGMHHNCCKLW